MDMLYFRKVICIGAPRLHEYLKNNTKIDSILLDFDKRFHQFYSKEEYCWYNMFNHHFFGGEISASIFQTYLKINE